MFLCCTWWALCCNQRNLELQRVLCVAPDGWICGQRSCCFTETTLRWFCRAGDVQRGGRVFFSAPWHCSKLAQGDEAQTGES